MKTHEIKSELYRRSGSIQTPIAKEVGVERQYVENVIRHIGTDRAARIIKIAHAVAAKIDRPIEEVYPELADAVGLLRSNCSCNG